MFKYIKKKLGINTIEENNRVLQDCILDLNTKVYESIKLLSIVLNKVEGNDTEQFNTLLEKINELESSITSKIKAIPKEIVVKNVLSI